MNNVQLMFSQLNIRGSVVKTEHALFLFINGS